MKPLDPAIKTLFLASQRLGRLPLAIAAVRQAAEAGLELFDRLVFGDTVSRLLEDTSVTDEAEACLAEDRLLFADTSAIDQLAAAIAACKAIEF
jgi:hypothetical protein